MSVRAAGILHERAPLPPRAHCFLGAILILVATGLGLLVAAGADKGLRLHGEPLFYFFRQFQGVALGGAALCVAAFVHPRVWLRMAPWLGLVTIALLLIVLLGGGVERNRAVRWIAVGGITFQPSELAKLVIPLLAGWGVHRFGPAGCRLSGGAAWLYPWLQLSFLLGGVTLVAVEPDYGTALFLTAIGMTVLMVSGLSARLPFLALIPMIPVGAWLFRERRDFVINRFQGMANPASVPQVQDSLEAIGAGGWTGLGIGQGLESHHLAEQQTDFIFAILAEETGFLGILALLVLFAVVLQSGWRVALRCPDPALKVVAIGMVLVMVLQAAINVAVATASAPTKGIPLPFISFGSTGLSVFLFMAGIVVGIARVREAPPGGQSANGGSS